MADDSESQDARSSKTSITHHSASSRPEVSITKERKKKIAAFQTFLETQPDPSSLESPLRRTDVAEQRLFYLSGVSDLLSTTVVLYMLLSEFCRDVVCLAHFRKRRRNSSTNKWTRICESCEDRYLMEKHFQSEVKTEESLLTQEAVLQAKQAELRQAIEQKKKMIEDMANKKGEAAERHRAEMDKLSALDKELDTKFAAAYSKRQENSNLQYSLNNLEKTLPASLQQDFQYLQSENARITKDLIKYDKLCVDAVRARIQRENDMYRQYYQWQERKRREMEAAQRQKEGCAIY